MSSIDPLHGAISDLEQEAFQHGHRSGQGMRVRDRPGDSLGAPHHEARAKALMLSDSYAAVVKASVRHFDCLCEFSDYGLESACQEHADTWAQAVIDYKKATGR